MRVALIHYWLVNDRGGEKVLRALYELYPQATIFTHVLDRSRISPAFKDARIETTFIQDMWSAKKRYRTYLPFMPAALEALDLSDYDLVISSESGPAKGIIPAPGAAHLCYVHSPMRYIWNMYAESMRRSGWGVRTLFPYISNYLRMWDVSSASRVDKFCSNSHNVAQRVKRYWNRDSHVIHPPVDLGETQFSASDDGFYLFVSELVDYKRADIVIDACKTLGRDLIVIGDGPMMKTLRGRAGRKTKFLGKVDGPTLRAHYAACKALLFPAEEDFGIVPLEAMASGKPVIAFGRGGALETVRDGLTGRFFAEQTPDSLAAAIEAFEASATRFDPLAIRAHAETFATPIFKARFKAWADESLANRRGPSLPRADAA